MDLTGLNAALYRGAVNTDPTTLVKNYRKLKLNREKLLGDNSRHSCKTKSSKPTMLKAAIEFEMLNSDSDADVAAFEAAFNTDTPLAIKSLDKANGNGVMGDWYVVKFERDEDEEKEQVISVSLEPTVEYRDVVPVEAGPA
jgi:hypothetical protein